MWKLSKFCVKAPCKPSALFSCRDPTHTHLSCPSSEISLSSSNEFLHSSLLDPVIAVPVLVWLFPLLCPGHLSMFRHEKFLTLLQLCHIPFYGVHCSVPVGVALVPSCATLQLCGLDKGLPLSEPRFLICSMLTGPASGCSEGLGWGLSCGTCLPWDSPAQNSSTRSALKTRRSGSKEPMWGCSWPFSLCLAAELLVCLIFRVLCTPLG